MRLNDGKEKRNEIMKYQRWVSVCFLILFLLILAPVTAVYSEEGMDAEAENLEEMEDTDEEEDPIPESYYYPIESNNVQGWPQGPAIESASAAVMDLDTGAFLYSKNATAKQYPASITKIMTTLLLVENCRLDDTITFSEIVYDIEEGSSHLGIKPGEKMTLRDAAYGIMLESANDISNGVAEYIAGSVSAFADMMNERAAELGCVNTHFANPHGLYRDDHYTCAHDMALIAQAAYKNPVFRKITGTQYYDIPETNLTEEVRYLRNHHNMIHSDTEYYRDWCTGGKNGYTEACLNTLVTFGEKDGKRLVGVVLRVNGAGKAYQETAQIMEYGFDEFLTKNVKISNSKINFYDIMNLRYFGTASDFQSAAWKRRVSSGCRVAVTIPRNASMQDLSHEVRSREGVLRRTVLYEYEGWPVGSARGVFYPIAGPVQLSFEGPSSWMEMNQAAEASAGANIQIESVEDLMEWVSGIFITCSQMFLEFTENNLFIAAAAGLAALILILMFLIILIFRCTSDHRIQKRRRQEEIERRKREEEIERMTTAEIEQELREVMEQERRRKEQMLREQAEAERAAAQADLMEKELRETEELLARLEREGQKRLNK